MENTIRETLKGLELALDERTQKADELSAKDSTVLVEEKRAELEKELEEKLNAFIAEIDAEKESTLAKLNRDIETIKELKAEYEAKLAEIEAEKAEEVVEAEENAEAEIVEEVVAEEAVVEEEPVKEEVQQSVLFGNPIVNHPFRP